MPSIIIPAADASASLDFEPPFLGFEYLNFFNGAATLTRNLIVGKPAPVVVGTPTFNADGSVRFTSAANFLNTNVAETAEITQFVAGRGVGSGTGTTRPIFIGNYAGATIDGNGTSLYAGSGAITGNTTTGVEGAFARTTSLANDPNAWDARAVRSGAEGLKVDALKSGVFSTQTMNGARAPSAATIRIGSGAAGTTFAGVSDVVCAAIVSRRISDAELAQLYQVAKIMAAKLGVAI